MTDKASRAAEQDKQWEVPPLGFESYREAAPHMRRPFMPAAIKFKVQATTDKWALIVPYIDARLVIERFNMLVPGLWYELEPIYRDEKTLIYRLVIDGIERRDVGVAQPGEQLAKSLYSDALKRAAVKFGVGVSLYATPRLFLEINSPHIKVRQRQGKKPTHEITEKGDARLRGLYEEWLHEVGEKNFGPALDHGDVVGSLGDPLEVNTPAAEENGGNGDVWDADGQPLLQGKEADDLRADCKATYKVLTQPPPKGIGKSAYPPGQFQGELQSAGHSLEELKKFRLSLKRRVVEAEEAQK